MGRRHVLLPAALGSGGGSERGAGELRRERRIPCCRRPGDPPSRLRPEGPRREPHKKELGAVPGSGRGKEGLLKEARVEEKYAELSGGTAAELGKESRKWGRQKDFFAS